MIVATIVLLFFTFLIYLRKKGYNPSIKNNTTILITGGCQGIGRHLIEIIASQISCTFIILDIIPLPDDLKNYLKA